MIVPRLFKLMNLPHSISLFSPPGVGDAHPHTLVWSKDSDTHRTKFACTRRAHHGPQVPAPPAPNGSLSHAQHSVFEGAERQHTLIRKLQGGRAAEGLGTAPESERTTVRPNVRGARPAKHPQIAAAPKQAKRAAECGGDQAHRWSVCRLDACGRSPLLAPRPL